MIALKSQNAASFTTLRKSLPSVLAVLCLGTCFLQSTRVEAASNSGIMHVGLVIGASSNIVKASNFSPSAHFTWGAAEVSVVKAGYSVRQRLDAADDVFWFKASKADHEVKIGVSSSSGQIVSMSAI